MLSNSGLSSLKIYILRLKDPSILLKMNIYKTKPCVTSDFESGLPHHTPLRDLCINYEALNNIIGD